MLSDTDRALLEFEQYWPDDSQKDARIRDEFGIPPVRYYQHLTRLLDDPDAEAEFTLLVRRLRRQREGRRK